MVARQDTGGGSRGRINPTCLATPWQKLWAYSPATGKERSIDRDAEQMPLWHHHKGNPGRDKYRSRKWADAQKTIGRHPSGTCVSGGRRQAIRCLRRRWKPAIKPHK